MNYAKFNTIEDFSNEKQDFEFEDKSNENVGVTRNEFNNEFMPYFLDKMMNTNIKMDRTNNVIKKNNETIQSNFLTMDKKFD